MIQQSRVASFAMLNESLGLANLSGGPICIYGIKVLTRATEDVGITLRKFVTWTAEDCDREARDKKSDFHWLPATALSNALLEARKIRQACHDHDAATCRS